MLFFFFLWQDMRAGHKEAGNGAGETTAGQSVRMDHHTVQAYGDKSELRLKEKKHRLEIRPET